MFLGRCQIHLVLKHGDSKVDDLTDEVLRVGYLGESFLECVTDAVLCGEEHGEVLGLLQHVRVGHHLEELGRPDTDTDR